MKSTRPDCILDVGANEGDFAVEVAALNPELLVIAFEPIPQLANHIEARARKLGLDNLVVRPEAILDIPGSLTLNIANHADMGVSSLLKFNRANIELDDYWRTRTDLYHEEQIDVPVARLDSILDELQVGNVVFLKIDAQGVDLKVLDSLGTYRPKAGMLESATTRSKALYFDEPDLTEALGKLREDDFIVWDIKPNDPACAEVNVFFAGQDVDFRQLEVEHSLLKISIYGDKHYWRNHSANAEELTSIETHVAMPSGISEIASLHRRVREYRFQVLGNLRELDRLQRRLDNLGLISLELDKVLSSRSWRWTRLVRVVASLFMRNK